jgi:tight adherence protein B
VTRRVVAVVVLTVAFFTVMPQRFSFGAGDPQPLEIVAVDTSAPPHVSITVRVPGELAGKKLGARNFTIVEGGRTRLPTLTRLPSDPLAVVLALDTSGSMQGAPIAAAKAAAVEFLQKVPAGTQVAVVGFSDAPMVVSPFTTDRNALTSAIQGVQASGETALYDGVNAAISQLAPMTGTRHAIVVLSDGGDTTSQATLQSTIGSLAGADTTFYAAALLTAESDLRALDQLAAAAGGRVVSASDPAGLSSLYDGIATAINSQYELSFKATSTGPTRLRVGVNADGVQAATDVNVNLATPAPVAKVTTHPVHVTEVSTPLLGGAGWALGLGAVLVFGALLVAGLVLIRPRESYSTLAAERRHGSPRRHDQMIGDVVSSASRFAEQQLEQRGKRSSLNDALDRAGIDMRPGEFAVLVAGVTLGVLFVGLLLFGPIVGVLLAVVVALGFRTWVSMRAERRRTKFADQLGDTLQLISGTLRSGHGLLQAIDTVAEEAESPTCEEFRRIVVETRLGKNLPDALHAACARVRNEDFDWVVEAIDIHREVGGDLAEVLDHVAGTIRSRNSIRRQVQALSAEGRLSAVILLVLPLGLVVVISIVNPSYLQELTDTTAGNVMIAGGIVLLGIGGLWLRRIVRIVF